MRFVAWKKHKLAQQKKHKLENSVRGVEFDEAPISQVQVLNFTKVKFSIDLRNWSVDEVKFSMDLRICTKEATLSKYI
jgi:hypothetical protein